jgi:hypothetical protein
MTVSILRLLVSSALRFLAAFLARLAGFVTMLGTVVRLPRSNHRWFKINS